MKLRARFPQILVGGRGLAASQASEVVQRSAFWPTTSSAADTLGHPLGPLPPIVRARAESPRSGWLSTVAAWRSTAGLNGDKS